jgi:hypothetical protein
MNLLAGRSLLTPELQKNCGGGGGTTNKVYNNRLTHIHSINEHKMHERKNLHCHTASKQFAK